MIAGLVLMLRVNVVDDFSCHVISLVFWVEFTEHFTCNLHESESPELIVHSYCIIMITKLVYNALEEWFPNLPPPHQPF